MNGPTFLGIGAHRAGTTWLHRALARHPEIWVAPVKELHWFDRSPVYPSRKDLSLASPVRRIGDPAGRHHLMKGLAGATKALTRGDRRELGWHLHWTFGRFDEAWYRRLFPTDGDHEVAGEITPSYAILDIADVREIARINPRMKLILSLRHPVERAWSALRYDAANGRHGVDLDSTASLIARLDERGPVLRGDYERTLDVYSSVFGAESILVVFYDAIVRTPGRVLDDIAGFLDVGPFPPGVSAPVNEAPATPMPPVVWSHLADRHRESTVRLATRLGSYTWDWAASMDGDVRGTTSERRATTHP